jgi:succinyl-diaminopimelate desuccinylase
MATEPAVTETEAADLLAELVAFDTRNPPGKERECAEFIHDLLAEWGLETRLVPEPYPDRPQVVAETGRGDEGAGTLALNGHIDVVSPGDPEQWVHPPFGGVNEAGRVYGRGTSDMKAGLAAAMLAGRAAARGDSVDGTLVLTFAVGEETGEPGTKHLVEDEIEADFGVVLEPTDLRVATAAKGIGWYTARVEGVSSHASHPSVGQNPLLALLSWADTLGAYQRELADRTHPLVGESLCTPTICRAGETQNVVPATAEIRFDRRFLPGEDIATIDGEMDALFDPLRADGFDVSVERTRVYEAAEIPVDARLARVFRGHAARVAGVDTDPYGKVAATDQRNFVNDAGIPAVIWGPGTPSQAHTVDEWARVDALVDSVHVLAGVVDELCDGAAPRGETTPDGSHSDGTN